MTLYIITYNNFLLLYVLMIYYILCPLNGNHQVSIMWVWPYLFHGYIISLYLSFDICHCLGSCFIILRIYVWSDSGRVPVFINIHYFYVAGIFIQGIKFWIFTLFLLVTFLWWINLFVSIFHLWSYQCWWKMLVMEVILKNW